MRPTPYVASLRVYEPITAFKLEDQARWSLVSLSAPSIWDEERNALQRTITIDPSITKLDGAHVIELDSLRYVAPWSTAIRCWAALDEFKSTLPISISKFFIPNSIEELINTSSEIVEDKVSHIISATWSIPPRWFALFEPSQWMCRAGPQKGRRVAVRGQRHQ